MSIEFTYTQQEVDTLCKVYYEKGRTDAEREFQNSDYWNDYLAKVIKDTRTDTINECISILAKSYDTILTDKQYYTLTDLIEEKEETNE